MEIYDYIKFKLAQVMECGNKDQIGWMNCNNHHRCTYLETHKSGGRPFSATHCYSFQLLNCPFSDVSLCIYGYFDQYFVFGDFDWSELEAKEEKRIRFNYSIFDHIWVHEVAAKLTNILLKRYIYFWAA